MTALDAIQRRSDPAAGFVAARSGDVAAAAAGLARMRRLCDALGNPERAYRTIHVTGSKGKGSTVAYAAAILTATGRTTGRYTSPHLMDWRERIAVDGVDVAEADFDRVVASVDSVMTRLEAERPDDPPHNAFELLTAAAFVHFREVGCEAAVIEVGIGGRFDSTNVVGSDVAVITSIQAEHLDMLGPTLTDVAWNKAGIVRPGRPCVTTAQLPDVLDVLEKEADAVGATLLLQGRDWSVGVSATALAIETPSGTYVGPPLPNPLESQRTNAAAAVVASSYLATPALAEIRAGLVAGKLPGRFEVFDGEPSVVLDVAHTADSIRSLGGAIRVRFSGSRVVALLGILDDKDVEAVADAVSGWADSVVATTAPSPRARPAGAVVSAFGARAADVHEVAEVDDAWSVARDVAGDDGVVVVTGSFALVAHVRRILLGPE